MEAGGVFFGGEYYFVFGGAVGEGGFHFFEVLADEVVMVGIGEGVDADGVGLEKSNQWFGAGDAANENDVFIVERDGLVGDEVVGLAILDGGEEYMLVGEWLDAGGDGLRLCGCELRRAFGNNNDIGAASGCTAFAEAAEGEDMIGIKGTGIVGNEYVEAGLYGAVLVGIVEDDNVYIGPALQQGGNAYHAFFGHANDELGKLEVVLHGLIANAEGIGVKIGNEESVGMPLVAAAHGGYLKLVLEQGDEVFDMGGFAGAAGGEVAHGDNGYCETDGGKKLSIV